MKEKNDIETVFAGGGDGAPGMSMGRVSIDITRMDKSKPDFDRLLLLPTRNLVLFPGVHLSVGLGRETTVQVARYAEDNNMRIGVVCQRNPDKDLPRGEDLYDHAVVADVLKVLDLPDDEHAALLRGHQSVRIDEVSDSMVIPGALVAKVTPVHEPVPRANNLEFEVIVQNIITASEKILEKVFDHGAPFNPKDLGSPVETVNAIATNMPLPVEEKEQMLATPRMKQRAMRLLQSLQRYKERIDVNAEIMQRARRGMEENQRNAFLQQQMEAIREELYGDADSDVDVMAEKLDSLILPDDIRTTLTKEIDKLRRLNPQSPDYSVQYSYLDTVLDLPWDKSTEVNEDFDLAENILENDHYGLEKVKERIIEQLAVVMDNPGGKAPILCLVGPPGVGKTSLGASVARALGRSYQRVALGGLHDEAEIRGHRRTYIGAMPGRIIDAMRRAGTDNPVLLLDEIDKIGADYKGDPSAALLEVLDPEQNCHFHDNYVDLDFDLSKVLFIATANTLQTVSRPLLDRVEIIEIPGYLVEEKIEIAKRHLLPHLLKEQDWEPDSLKITDEALTAIIDNYTGESGVRQLEKRLAAILRKAVLARRRGKDFPQPVTAEMLKDLLGTAPYHKDRCPDKDLPGVVTGLAWTQAGGEILLVEVSLSRAKQGGKLTLTGNLGDVMKESAAIALEWVRAHAESLNISSDKFETNNFHVHFPEGAIPKDGPSAGITMATAIVSALTGRPTRHGLAMTGEITLRGQVLPVGGIREKILAARRAGATDIILSTENRRDVDDIPAAYLDGLTIHYVDTVADVMEQALQ